MRPWPDSLAGRTVSLLIGMTLLLILGSAVLLHDERKERFDERDRSHLFERVTTLVRLLADADDAERQRVIQRAAETGDVISLSDAARIAGQSRRPLERRIAHELRRALHLRDRSAVRVAMLYRAGDNERRDDSEWRREHAESDGAPRHFAARLRDLRGIRIAVRLRDGVWLDFTTNRFKAPPPWSRETLYLLALLLASVIGSGLLIARRMARPMAQLAQAANRLGLGQAQAALPETGPREVRNTIRAFNLMQQRLRKHISDRSQMLAAVSHDLRTPITTLRLRAEYIDDAEMREKTLATLAEMEAILSATLSFARDEAADEKARPTDLAALLQSIVDDHADLGGDVVYHGPDRVIFACRPVALKRALNNLIDNALKYGETAEVRLFEEADAVRICIDDSGPGIPEGELENVFTPFFRLEQSRNRATGGSGLGLSVARTVVHAHGGQLTLANRSQGGLRASMRLPR